jgi:cell division protein FtsB
MNDQYYRKEKPKPTAIQWLKKNLKNKTIRYTLLVGIPVVSFMVFGNRGVLQRMSLETQKAEMQDKIRMAIEEQRRLQQQSKALDSDKNAIEKVAREKYGMMREGETVYKIKKTND